MEPQAPRIVEAIQQEPAESRRRTAETMLLATTLIWGATFGITKTLLGTMPPMGLLTWRFGLAALLFLLIFHRRLASGFTRTGLIQGSILGVFLYAGFALQTLGLSFTSSSRSGFITSLYVVMTPLLQIAVTRKLPGRQVFLGLAIVMIGLWGLTAPAGTPDGLLQPWREGGFGIGDLLTLCCAASFAIYIILLDRFARKANVVLLTAVQLLLTTLLAAITNALTEPWSTPTRILDWTLLLYLSIFATVFSTYWQTRYQPDTSPTRAAIIYTMEAVFAAVIGMLILGESLGPIAMIGGGLIVTGLLVVELKR